MKKKHILLILYLVILILGLTSPVLAETNAYDLSWWTVDSGGATGLTAGSYTLSGTAGQPDADSLSGGDYDLAGGFWGALIVKLQNYLPLIKR